MPKKRRKNSDIPPSSIPGGSAPRGPLLVARVVVRMLTTAGPTLSTRSVKSGRLAAEAANAVGGSTANMPPPPRPRGICAPRKSSYRRKPRDSGVGELLRSLVFYGRGKLLQRGLGHFAEQGNPEIAAPLHQHVRRAAAARAFLARVVLNRLDEHRDRGEPVREHSLIDRNGRLARLARRHRTTQFADLAKTRHRGPELPALCSHIHRFNGRAHHGPAGGIANAVDNASLVDGHADANLGERQLFEHLAVRVERLRAQQQAGLLVGPQFVSEAVRVFRIEFD